MSTQVKPEYSVSEGSTVLATPTEALKALGATTFISDASGFGSAPLIAVRYPLNEQRVEVKANILGEKDE
jgi:hypothetical protein